MATKSAHRADADLIKALNAGGAYKESIANRENIGVSAGGLAAIEAFFAAMSPPCQRTCMPPPGTYVLLPRMF